MTGITQPNKIKTFNFVRDTNANILQNGRFQFAQKHALSLYRQKAIYTFIPKNACTTLRASIAYANGFIRKDQLDGHINWIHNNSYTFSAQLHELVTADYTFTILRNPHSRIVSLYLDKFVDKTPVAWTFYRQTNNYKDLDDISFTDFVKKLQSQPNLINADIHWKRQSDFLIYNRYDDYFDFDDFDGIRKTLKQKINLELLDTRTITNHGREKHKKVTGDFSNTRALELKKLKDQGQLPTIQSLLTPKLIETIELIYSSDFRIIQDVLSK